MSNVASPSAGSLEFRLAGIPVTVRPSFWAVSVALGWATRSAALIAVWVAVVFVSVLIHEMGHALCARAFGGQPRIEMHTMGGTATLNAGAIAPWQHIAVCLAGPALGVLVGLAAIAVQASLGPDEHSAILETALRDLIWINCGYGLLNFLPIVPLDGGQVMRIVVERLRGEPATTLVSALSLGFAVALAVVAYLRAYHWAFFMLAWLGVRHSRAVLQWLDERRDRALDREFNEVYAAVGRDAFGEALPRARALGRQMRTPEGKARALTSVADIALRAGQPAIALEALDAFPEGWLLPASLELAVLAANGATARAVESMRSQRAATDDPTVLHALVTALQLADDFDEAVRTALGATEAMGRDALYTLAARLHHRARFEQSVRVSSAAFEAFRQPDDAYNAGCSAARLGQTDEAMSWLSRAVTAGYHDEAHLIADDDFAALRDRPDFAALCASLPRDAHRVRAEHTQ